MLEIQQHELTEVTFFRRENNIKCYIITYNNHKILGFHIDDLVDLVDFVNEREGIDFVDDIIKKVDMIQEYHIDGILPFFGYCHYDAHGLYGTFLLTSYINLTTTNKLIEINPDRFDLLHYAKILNRTHSFGLNFGNLSLGNIDLSNKGFVYLLPFKHKIDRQKFMYVAPERLLNNDSTMLTDKSDIYSFGYIMYEFLTKQSAYPNIIGLTYDKHIENITNGIFPAFNEKFNEYHGIWELINRCWSINPDDRPTSQELCNEIFIIFVESKLHNRENTITWCSNTSNNEIPLITLLRVIGFDMEKYDTIRDFFNRDIISIDDFSRALTMNPSLTTTDSFDRIYELYKHDWFHGDISVDESTRRLLSTGRNSFLIRASSQPGFLVISHSQTDVSPIRVNHSRFVVHLNGTYGNANTTLEGIINIVAKNSFPCNRKDFN